MSFRFFYFLLWPWHLPGLAALDELGDINAYNPGWCYQPMYWPSDCVQPEPPTTAEINKMRRNTTRSGEPKR